MEKMLTIPIPAGDFTQSPQHVEPALLLTESQWREMRDKIIAALEAE